MIHESTLWNGGRKKLEKGEWVKGKGEEWK
jgi:hypothetical protein